ncbi:DUF1080 domain-containing protein [bacterium]|nr:DUF1080 domain-containing protein [bacterium]
MKEFDRSRICFLSSIIASLGLIGLLAQTNLFAQPDPHWLDHDRDRPAPPVVDPGTFSTQEQPGRPPSDAVVLFDGHDISKWVAMDGSPTQWVIKDGAMECVPGSGYVRTLESFGDCQFHVEWATPNPPHGEGQGRGNSGVFFGMGSYEIQVLDSYGSRTYSDGSAASVYGQYPPLVNASRAPGQWQYYDIIWTAPKFDQDGVLQSKAHVTVFHNGVLVQNNVELTGPTSWLQRAPYPVQPEKLPIAFQDHGNPVRYRNVWVRPLDKSGKHEYYLAESVLDRYVGEFDRGGDIVTVRRAANGQLAVSFSGAKFLMFAESPTHFFAKTTDVQIEFDESGQSGTLSVGEGGMPIKRVK